MPGQIVHTEILVDDTEAARAFWGPLFGWEFEAYPPGSEYHMSRISETSGIAISGMESGRSGTRSYFDVDDIDAGIAWVQAAVELGFINHEVLARRDPFLASLRRDPRYQALMADVAHRTQALWI